MGVVLCVLLAFVIWFIIEGMESAPPELTLVSPLEVIGANGRLEATAFDRQSGIKRIWIALNQQGREITLLDQQYPSQGVFMKGGVRDHTVSLDIKPIEMGFKDGELNLRISVWDHSFAGWGKGNQRYEETTLRVDTTEPTIEMVSRIHNLNQGGAGVAVFKTDGDVVTIGVMAGDRFFPASSGGFDDPDVFLCFFALSHEMGPETPLMVKATDRAGNTNTTRFYNYINKKKFHKETILISDRFLKKKLPEFAEALDWSPSATPVERFVSVNRNLRKSNYHTIRDICSESDPKKHWSGPFLRLPASERKASYGDQRTYVYGDTIVDEQVHLGIDLASKALSPVPSSNNGRVVFTGDLGIYGKTVIVDHGFHLFSMYSHLSQFFVKKGTMVQKGERVGLTGTTGMAAGDHLHFGILIAHTFVNPLEWWDPNWIQHNVTTKIQRAKEKVGSFERESVL